MSNYKDVKNYIHNEEKITKEEIREIIQEAVNVEVKRIVESKEGQINDIVTDYIRQLVRYAINDKGCLAWGFKERVAQQLSNEVGNFIVKQLKIDIAVKD